MNQPISDQDYERTLARERHMFAWCLAVYGGAAEEDAQAKAREAYPREQPGTENRGLVFHEDAWHWAMLRIYGAGYWRTRPEAEKPSAQYLAEWQRFTDES